jgi:transposase
VRCFEAYTVDFAALADWWARCCLTTVALESAGVSGIPRFELWESRGFEVLLVDPQPVRKIRGRPKRGVQDGQGRQRLQTFGRLASAFRPPDDVCILRSDLRQRPMLLT